MMFWILKLSVSAFVLLSFVTLPGNLAVAQDPEIIKRLRGETVTVFDAGIKRLRRAALEASERLSSAAEPGPKTRVWYDVNTGTIEIEFRFTNPTGDKAALSRARCIEKHKAAIREIFKIGKTIYAVPFTFDERVRRRLGALFSLEPVQNVNEGIALGQRMSELTFLRIEIAEPQNIQTISCRDRIAPVMGRK